MNERNELISLWAHVRGIPEEEAVLELEKDYTYVWTIALAGLGKGNIYYHTRMVPIYVEDGNVIYPDGDMEMSNNNREADPQDVMDDELWSEDESMVIRVLKAFWKHHNAPGLELSQMIDTAEAFYESRGEQQ